MIIKNHSYISIYILYLVQSWIIYYSMSKLKEAVRELLQRIIMGLGYKNVNYQQKKTI